MKWVWTEERLQVLREGYAAGKTAAELVPVLGATKDAIRQAALRHGISWTRPETPHGYHRYKRLGCRCRVCTDANTAYYRERRRKKWGTPPNRHGTRTGYEIHGCRCEPCRAWKSAENATTYAGRSA